MSAALKRDCLKGFESVSGVLNVPGYIPTLRYPQPLRIKPRQFCCLFYGFFSG